MLQVSDGVARIYGLTNAEAGELLEFECGVMGVVMNLEVDNVGAVLLGPTDEIKEGMSVKRTGRIASIGVSEEMLGRVVDPLGNPIDEGRDAAGAQGAGRNLPSACERTSPDRYQGHRCHDSYRSRSA